MSCWASATGIYGNSSTDWTAKDGLADPDDIPELPEEPITKTGDLWLLGLHGRQPPAVEGEQARDPDEGRDSYKDPESAVGSRSTSSRQPPAPRRAGPDLSMACVDAAVTGGRGVVKDRTARPQVIIWVKTRGVLTALAFMWQHEPCMYGWKQGKMLNLKPPANETTVWHVDQKGEQDGIRPTADALPHEEGGICFEPFSGSRTYIIAAELTERAATLSTRSLLILMSRSRAGNR